VFVLSSLDCQQDSAAGRSSNSVRTSICKCSASMEIDRSCCVSGLRRRTEVRSSRVNQAYVARPSLMYCIPSLRGGYSHQHVHQVRHKWMQTKDHEWAHKWTSFVTPTSIDFLHFISKRFSKSELPGKRHVASAPEPNCQVPGTPWALVVVQLAKPRNTLASSLL
jgi:hypothetical protein